MFRPAPLCAGLVLALGVAAGVPRAVAEEPPRRPNIVFLYTDDQARWGLGTYGNGEVETPNMDRIAREGAVFRNAFTATPVCSPSRAGMFCGRYGTQVGITDWINPRAEPELGLDPSAIGWPELQWQDRSELGLAESQCAGPPELSVLQRSK